MTTIINNADYTAGASDTPKSKKAKIIRINTSSLSCLLDEINNNYNIIQNIEKTETGNETGDETGDEIGDDEERVDDCINGADDVEKNGYYYKNREKKLEYQKKYNKEMGDKIKNYNKEYYQKRREEILEKAKTKIICECGCSVQLFNMNSHKKTKKHLKALQVTSGKK
jgi:hypothetical protein